MRSMTMQSVMVDNLHTKFSYTTDNAAMIASVGNFKYQDKDFTQMDIPVFSKVTFE